MSANSVGRRAFLTGAAASIAVSAVAHNSADPLADKVVVNTLGGISDPDQDNNTDITPQVLARAHQSGLTAVVVTLAASGDPYPTAVSEIAQWQRWFAAHPDLLHIKRARDIRIAKAAGQIGILFGFQNTSAIGTDLQRIDRFQEAGLRVIQLTYNTTNLVGSGASEPADRGLTPFGRDVVRRLNEKRLIVDLAHSNYRTCMDATAASTAPIAISHTGCSALYDLPRNKTDEELRAVAGKGGYVGIYFLGGFLVRGRDATAEDVVAHIEHAIQVCGEDHVGVGTDFGLDPIDNIAAERATMTKRIEARRAQGISAPGEIPGMLPFTPDLTGPNQFRRLAAVLQKRGHRAARIEKVLGLNFLRYANEVWGS